MKILKLMISVPLIFILALVSAFMQLALKIISIVGGIIWVFLAVFALLAFFTKQWNQLIAAGVIAGVVFLFIFAGSFFTVLITEFVNRL